MSNVFIAFQKNEDSRAIVNAILADITRDERIMGAAACSMDGHPVASTVGFPPAFTCRSTVDRLRQQSVAAGRTWSMSTDLPAGRVQLSATTLEGEAGPLGVILGLWIIGSALGCLIASLMTHS